MGNVICWKISMEEGIKGIIFKTIRNVSNGSLLKMNFSPEIVHKKVSW